ncbi:hypothetical protein MATL_G00002680 [Megalops atlanticus]|uniref:NACHT LRR and PYD domain-containing protein n=1 Tax=Megalops atlanticus TaxID=7932 RepID=A0A9D3TKP7_MEGAT|nr:hypothetical protein MATL_G00002680 [Megalops atlanticus]
MLQGKALRKKKVYCFIHLSIQEYFTALYMFLSYKNEATNPLDPAEKAPALSDLHKSAVKRALKSQNGHLDLFLCFFLGLGHGSLADLPGEPPDVDGVGLGQHQLFVFETRDFIKGQIRRVSSPERCITLFHCLTELNDNSLVEEIRSCMSSGGLAGGRLSPEQLSALAYAWLMSGELIDLFDLKQYYTPPATRGCSRSSGTPGRPCECRLVLSGCRVTQAGCASLASALRSNPSHLRELDLSYNHPGDAGVKALEDPSCKLERLITDHIGEHRNKPKLLKYACQLTLDPNTAHCQLRLSDGAGR